MYLTDGLKLMDFSEPLHVKYIKPFIQGCLKAIFDSIFLLICIPTLIVARSVHPISNSRILMGLIANNNLIYLRDTLRSKGYKAQCIPWRIPNNELNVINYDLDIASKYPKLYKNWWGQQILIYAFFVWSIFKFDIFIMPFQNRLLDRTFFLKWLEFQLLHFCKKIVILNPYGGDIQNPKVWEQSADPIFKLILQAWKSDPYYSQVSDKSIQKNNNYCQKYADTIIVSLEWPDYLERCDYYFHMRCIHIRNYVKKTSNSNLFKIVHATNHSHFKGTEFLEKAVAEINSPDVRCELVILKNATNNTVLSEIQEADVVFDQILLGAYGRLAIEAMSLGVPVLCYLRDDLKALYPFWKECPILNVNLYNIKAAIEKLMNMSVDERSTIGLQSRVYVAKYHSPEFVADFLDSIIQKGVNNGTN